MIKSETIFKDCFLIIEIHYEYFYRVFKLLIVRGNSKHQENVILQ